MTWSGSLLRFGMAQPEIYSVDSPPHPSPGGCDDGIVTYAVYGIGLTSVSQQHKRFSPISRRAAKKYHKDVTKAMFVVLATLSFRLLVHLKTDGEGSP